jgi:hypothetical protein
MPVISEQSCGSTECEPERGLHHYYFKKIRLGIVLKKGCRPDWNPEWRNLHIAKPSVRRRGVARRVLAPRVRSCAKPCGSFPVFITVIAVPVDDIWDMVELVAINWNFNGWGGQAKDRPAPVTRSPGRKVSVFGSKRFSFVRRGLRCNRVKA